MRKRDELKDVKSCLNRALDDEWLFVLLERDRAATVAVRAWIDERVRLGKNQPTDAQIIEAENWIKTVRRLQGLARSQGSTMRQEIREPK